MTERRPIYLEQDPPKEMRFLAFSGDDWHNACLVFTKKYGVEPEAVFKAKKLIFVGPVPEQKELT